MRLAVKAGAVALLHDDALYRWDGRAFTLFEQGFSAVRAAVRAERARYDGAARALADADRLVTVVREQIADARPDRWFVLAHEDRSTRHARPREAIR